MSDMQSPTSLNNTRFYYSAKQENEDEDDGEIVVNLKSTDKVQEESPLK
jgi:hypothetical protein